MCGVRTSCLEVLLQLLAIGLSNGAVIALNALGVTLVYGAVRTINFAHGDLFALATVVITFVIRQLSLQQGHAMIALLSGLSLALGAGLLFGTTLNIAVERLAFRPFRGGSRLAPVIASVGLSFVLYQAALIWRKLQPDWIRTEHRSVPGIPEVPRLAIPDFLGRENLLEGSTLDVVYTLKDLLVLAIAVGLVLAVTWFLKHTRDGQALRACAQDAELARLCGVDHNRTIMLAFGIGGALAGAAAFVFALYYDRPFGQHGAQSGLVALTAAVLGGIGRPVGAFWAGLLLGVLAALSDHFLAAHWTPIIVLAVLILVMVVRPTGLTSEERGEDLTVVPPEETVTGYRRARPASAWTIPVVAGAALLLPHLGDFLGVHIEIVLTRVLLFVLLALGLNILLGFAGMLDLGYAASYVIGAYTAALLTDVWGPLGSMTHTTGDFFVVVAMSAVVAALVGALLGIFTLRLRSDYLAIVTLAFAQIMPQLLINLKPFTGGAAGLAALPPPRLFGYVVRAPLIWYYLTLAVVLLVIAGSLRLVSSRRGRAWMAASEDRLAAVSSGVDASRDRIVAWALGAGVAGVAGALFAMVSGYVDPGQSDFLISAMVLAMVVIGGAGSVWGAVVGALLVGSYDLFGVGLIGALVEELARATGSPVLVLLDLRALSVGSFGIALYITMLIRGRRGLRSAAP